MAVNSIPSTFGTGGSGLNPTSDPVNNLAKILTDHATAINSLLGTSVETLGACVVVSVTNITLSGTQTIDGVAVVAGNRVLVTGQSAPANNGIYVAASGSWVRSTDFNSTTQMIAGLLVPVFSGTTYGGSIWEFTTQPPIGLGSTSLTFEQSSGSSIIYVGSDLQGNGTSGSPLNLSTTNELLLAQVGGSILSRAQGLIPAAGFNSILGSDFDNSAWFSTTGSTGTGSGATMSTTAKSGVVTLTGGPNASGVGVLIPAGLGSMIDNARTSPWYMYHRINIPVVNSTNSARLGLVEISGGATAQPALFLGLSNAVSTTHFSYCITNSGGTALISGTGPLLDTNWHTFEAYNDGTTLTIMFDSVSIGTTPATNLPGLAMVMAAVTLNGTTAAASSINIDKMWFVCQGN